MIRSPCSCHMISPKPMPSSPSRASPGTRTSTSESSAVSEDRMPSLSSFLATLKPGRSVSTRNNDTPEWSPGLPAVRTTIVQKSARVPLVV